MKCCIHPAASAAPQHARASVVTSSTITLVWETVSCIHRNGDITGYSVQYGVVGSENTQTLSVLRRSFTMTGLTFSTKYSIKIAAHGGHGTGIYTSTIYVTTHGKYFIIIHICRAHIVLA